MSDVDTSAAPWDGVPQNPELDGWHWLRMGGVFVAPYRWTAGKVDPRNGFWLYPPDWEIMPEDKLISRQAYLGPCLLPSEHAALLAERAALRAERDAERQLRITLERQREAANRYGDECHAALAAAPKPGESA